MEHDFLHIDLRHVSFTGNPNGLPPQAGGAVLQQHVGNHVHYRHHPKWVPKTLTWCERKGANGGTPMGF